MFIVFYLIVALCVILIKAEEETIYNISSFRSNPMGLAEKEGFWRVRLGIPEGCRILAYVDFNNDKYTDIITACEGAEKESLIKFFQYVPNMAIFVEDTNKNIPAYTWEYTINSLVANSINGDNNLDLIVTVHNTITDKQSTDIFISTEASQFDRVKTIEGGVLVGDFNGDRLIDVLYYNKTEQERKFIYYKNSSFYIKNFSLLFSQEKECDGNQIYNKLPLPEIHSSAFVDLDGDCRNDILITSAESSSKLNLEIWRGRIENNEIKYCLPLNSVYELSPKLGLFVIADIDRNGLLDIVFPIKDQCSIFIAYNKIDFKFDWTDDYCETHKTEKQPPEVFDKFDLNNKSANTDIIPLGIDSEEQFYITEEIGTVLRVGDVDSDSYPDIVTVIKSNNLTRTRIYINTKKEYPENFDGVRRRTFLTNNTKTLPVDNSFYASFFDLDETGQLDCLIVSKNSTSKMLNLMGYYNNYIYDTFFLKSETMLSKNTFFSSELGTNYRFIATNIDGSRRLDVAYQSAQLNQLQLNLPYSLIGIGRSNNYIENFHVISNVYSPEQENTKVFTPIIPNSQLLISKELDINSGQINWEIDLVVKPTSKLLLLIIVIAVILAIILGLIIYLHIREVKEDQVAESKTFSAWYS